MEPPKRRVHWCRHGSRLIFTQVFYSILPGYFRAGHEPRQIIAEDHFHQKFVSCFSGAQLPDGTAHLLRRGSIAARLLQGLTFNR